MRSWFGVCIAAIAVGMIDEQSAAWIGGASGRRASRPEPTPRGTTGEPLELDDSNDEIVIDFEAGRSGE